MEARKGKVLMLPAEKHKCPVDASALGPIETPEPIKYGKLHYELEVFATQEAAKRIINKRPTIETGSIVATVVSPLEKTPTDPVIITGLPEQIYWIMVASLYETGGRISFNTAPLQCTCVDVTILSYLKGEINVSLDCFGCRKYTDVADDELSVGIPLTKLDKVAKALTKLSEKMIPRGRQKSLI